MLERGRKLQSHEDRRYCDFNDIYSPVIPLVVIRYSPVIPLVVIRYFISLANVFDYELVTMSTGTNDTPL